MSIEVNPKPTLELLKRLEGKGVPLKLESQGYSDGWCSSNAIPFRRIDISATGELVNDGDDWLIIGCIVEYMEAQGWLFYVRCVDYEPRRYVCTFRTLFLQEEAEAGTLLETVLEAADKALS